MDTNKIVIINIQKVSRKLSLDEESHEIKKKRLEIPVSSGSDDEGSPGNNVKEVHVTGSDSDSSVCLPKKGVKPTAAQNHRYEESDSNDCSDFEPGESLTTKPGILPRKLESSTSRDERMSLEEIDAFLQNADQSILKFIAKQASTKIVVPGLMTMPEIKKLAQELEITKTVQKTMGGERRRPRNNERSDVDEDESSDSEDSEEEIAPGEWEVEAILDWGLDDHGKVRYEVKWKGWGGDHTWEPAENLKNCKELLKEFRKKKLQEDTLQTEMKLTNLHLILRKLTSDQGDLGVLLKLCGVLDKDAPESGKWDAEWRDGEGKLLQTPILHRKKIRELKTSLRNSCSLLFSYYSSGSEEKKKYKNYDVLNLTVSKLEIKKRFETVEKLITFCNEREETLKELKNLEDHLNKCICDTKDGPDITIENLFDCELPKKFTFISKYDYSDISLPEQSVIRCSCSDCGLQGYGERKKNRCNCIVECNKMPYNENGTLVLDAREKIYECNTACRCAGRCRFGVISRGRNLKFTIFKTPDGRGYGLRTDQRIPKGKYIMSYIGEVITAATANSRDKSQEHQMCTYMFDLDFNDVEEVQYSVDARFKGNLSRFINHSCEPNLQINPCWSDIQDPNLPTIAFFSARVIQAGEELTIDYNANLQENYDQLLHEVGLDGEVADQIIREDTQNFSVFCKCQAKTCRGMVM